MHYKHHFLFSLLKPTDFDYNKSTANLYEQHVGWIEAKESPLQRSLSRRRFQFMCKLGGKDNAQHACRNNNGGNE